MVIWMGHARFQEERHRLCRVSITLFRVQTIEPALAIPETHAKERLSLAYMQAITAQAGLNVRRWDWDDGIDMEVGTNKPIEGISFPNLAIPIQVKATAAWEIKDDHIAFSLNAKTYDNLRRATIPSQFLVLYTLPESKAQWLTYAADHCRMFNVAHYLNLAGSPALALGTDGEPHHSKTVRVPVANRLTAEVLASLFEDACQTVRQMRCRHE